MAKTLLLLCRHSQLLDWGSLLKQGHVGLDTPAVTGKARLHLRRIAIGFPEAAAGEILPLVFDEADHIPERVAQEQADLMGKFRLGSQAAGQLFQQSVQICPRISNPFQKFRQALSDRSCSKCFRRYT